MAETVFGGRARAFTMIPEELQVVCQKAITITTTALAGIDLHTHPV
jgi:hypothetical protein